LKNQHLFNAVLERTRACVCMCVYVCVRENTN